MSADAGLSHNAEFECTMRTITAQVWWVPTIMPVPATTSLGSSISQHLRAIKRLLQDMACGIKYVWNGQNASRQVTEIRARSIANTLDETEVGPTNETDIRAVTHISFSFRPMFLSRMHSRSFA